MKPSGSKSPIFSPNTALIMNNQSPKNQILIYTGWSGQPVIKVQTDGETVWLNQAQLAELFGTSKQNISLHIQNIFQEGELSREATVKEYLTVQKEGNREVSRNKPHYNLDLIISLGYMDFKTK